MRRVRLGRMVAALAAVLLSTSAATGHAMPSEPDTPALYIVVLSPGPNWRAGAPMEQQDLRAHFHHLRDMHTQGRLKLAGPVGADGGIVIFEARDDAEAAAMVAADPAVRDGVFVGSARPFTPRFVSETPLVPVPVTRPASAD